MTNARTLLLVLFVGAAGCGGGGGGQPDAAPNVEVLDPEPAGAPTGIVVATDTDLSCLGKRPTPASGSAVELTGYVRTLDDPTAQAAPPAATVQAYTAGGDLLGTDYADASKQGRVAISVSFQGDGFDGYTVVSDPAYLDYRFESSRLVTSPEVNAFVWLVNDADVATWESTLGITQDAGNGILFGSVQDCLAFALENVVVQVSGSTDGIYYPDGPAPSVCPTGAACPRPFAAADGTYTNDTGRFFLPNVPPGPVTVKVFGRLTAGGPLTLLSSIQTQVTAGAITGVAMLPRMGAE